MNKSTEKFSYTYSAPTEAERREIESIRSHYEPPREEEGKLRRLRELDAHVRSVPTAIAISVGVIGLLIFGLGLTMILEWALTVPGVVVAALGLPLIILAKPIHSFVSKREKQKFSPEIIRLSEELLGNDGKDA